MLGRHVDVGQGFLFSLLNTTVLRYGYGRMKNDEFIGVRVSGELRKDLERERRRMTKAAGAEVTESAVIRAILTRALRGAPKRRSRRAEHVA